VAQDFLLSMLLRRLREKYRKLERLLDIKLQKRDVIFMSKTYRQVSRKMKYSIFSKDLVRLKTLNMMMGPQMEIVLLLFALKNRQMQLRLNKNCTIRFSKDTH